MAKRIKAMRGTHDVLPEQASRWRAIEDEFAKICRQYGYREIRTPIFEATELFERGTGFSTDVVQKEMYTFEDKKGRRVSLRPEATPSVIRAYLEHSLAKQGKVLKLFYLGPMFRYDRPGAGRYRQFHQLGIEIIGTPSAVADAEAIVLLWEFLRGIGLSGLKMRVNSLGCEKCRVEYSRLIREFLKERLERLCDDCHERFERNPLRVLDCKQEMCKAVVAEAPEIGSILCEACQEHLAEVENLVSQANVDYYIDSRLVRGLDYYTRTVFEVFHVSSGVDNSLGGGGRYDRLVEDLGGPQTPAVGFSAGMERIAQALEADGVDVKGESRLDVFIAPMGKQAFPTAFKLALDLRQALSVWLEFDDRKIDRQLRSASRLGARFAAIIGSEEISKGIVKMKDMISGEQFEVPQSEALKWLKHRLKEDSLE